MNNLLKVRDECSKCENLLQCELCRQGHGIGQERNNISKMLKCQWEHEEKRIKK